LTLATHASALKAHRQSIVRRERNRQYRSRLRSALKAARASATSGDAAKAKDALKGTISLIDRMVSKGIIHKNTAARYKSRLVKKGGKAA
jgi:small subunit ribosomal protein S20